MPAILTPALRLALVAMVRQGVPLKVASATKYIKPKTIQSWLTCGMNYEEDPSLKKRKSDPLIEWDGQYFKESVIEAHKKECKKLYDEATAGEATKVGTLIGMMWNTALHPKYADGDMQKFLFKQYTHAHGLGAPQFSEKQLKDAAAGPDSGDADIDALVHIYLPENGRDK